ncbi:inorganic phosphate transporter [Caulobacter segnis]
MPLWVVLSCQTAMALGTLLGPLAGASFAAMGSKITRLSPMQGFCAETGGAATAVRRDGLRHPVSTTHTITGASRRVGFSRRVSAVRRGVAKDIVRAAWITPCRRRPSRRRCSITSDFDEVTASGGKQEGRKSGGGKRRQVAALPWRGEGPDLAHPARLLARDPPLGDPQGLADERQDRRRRRPGSLRSRTGRRDRRQAGRRRVPQAGRAARRAWCEGRRLLPLQVTGEHATWPGEGPAHP